MKRDSAIFSVFALLLTGPLFAQEQGPGLTLFEDTGEQEERQQNVREPERAQTRNAQPAFTLKGTSRFGDDYKAFLLSRDGEPITVSWQEGRLSRLNGYDGFGVVDVDSRTVSLQLPAGETCVESREKGVSCSTGANIALLTLSTAQPLARNVEQNQTVVAQADGQDTPEQAEGGEGQAQDPLFINPFSGEPQVVPEISEEERAARAARQEARRQALQNFQPVRISPDEVPPGMRVVSTPFGDRLVPADEE